MTDHLTDRILIPLANEDDATRTVNALEKRLGPTVSELYFIHVIEKAGGAPDKAPLEAREDQAERIFELIHAQFTDTEYTFDTELRYGTDIPDEIVAAAEDLDATAIAFVPRPSSRISAILSGNFTERLVSNNQFPVIVLPQNTKVRD